MVRHSKIGEKDTDVVRSLGPPQVAGEQCGPVRMRVTHADRVGHVAQGSE